MEKANIYELSELKPGTRTTVTIMNREKALIHFHYYAPGSGRAVHVHEESDDLWFLVEGEGVAVIGGKEESVRKGDAIMTPAGTSHGLWNRGKEPMIVLDVLTPRPRRD